MFEQRRNKQISVFNMEHYFGSNICNSLQRWKNREQTETHFKVTIRVEVRNDKYLDLYTGSREYGRIKKRKKD